MRVCGTAFHQSGNDDGGLNGSNQTERVSPPNVKGAKRRYKRPAGRLLKKCVAPGIGANDFFNGRLTECGLHAEEKEKEHDGIDQRRTEKIGNDHRYPPWFRPEVRAIAGLRPMPANVQ